MIEEETGESEEASANVADNVAEVLGVIEEETGESEEASANVADVLCAAITSFKCYLGKMPIDDLTAKKPLDAYRAFRKASS